MAVVSALYTLNRENTRVERAERRGSCDIIDIIFADTNIVTERGDDLAARLIVFYAEIQPQQSMTKGHHVERIMMFVADDVDMDGEEYSESIARVRMLFNLREEVEEEDVLVMRGKLVPEIWPELDE